MHINDYIVSVITDSEKLPGDLLYYAKDMAISPLIQTALRERFEARGWNLYFVVDEENKQKTRIYLAHPQEKYRPPQPFDYHERAYPPPSLFLRLGDWWKTTLS